MASSSHLKRAARIRLLLMDCDGVLTDGRIHLLDDGSEMKSFHVRDGQGLALWHRAGGLSGVVSGRASLALEVRARELGIHFVRQGVGDKVAAFESLLAEANVCAAEVAFIGDDLADVPLMRRVGFAVAVADACIEARRAAHHVTKKAGGHGAVRELIELLLRAQKKWRLLVPR